jgi:hypothetical protein
MPTVCKKNNEHFSVASYSGTLQRKCVRDYDYGVEIPSGLGLNKGSQIFCLKAFIFYTGWILL